MVHKIHSSVRYDSGVTVRYVWGRGNWLRLNVGNISVLNHEGELMDITSTRLHQDLHSCKLCARFMPKNILISVISLQTESESKMEWQSLRHLTPLILVGCIYTAGLDYQFRFCDYPIFWTTCLHFF